MGKKKYKSSFIEEPLKYISEFCSQISPECVFYERGSLDFLDFYPYLYFSPYPPVSWLILNNFFYRQIEKRGLWEPVEIIRERFQKIKNSDKFKKDFKNYRKERKELLNKFSSELIKENGLEVLTYMEPPRFLRSISDIIIPIKNDEPAFAFKRIDRVFMIRDLGNSNCELLPAISIAVYWKRQEYMFEDMPGVIEQQYGKEFTSCLKYPDKFFSLEKLPKSVFEIPKKFDSIFKHKTDIIRELYITPYKKFLRETGDLKERRGRRKKDEIKIIRDNFIIEEFKEMQKNGLSTSWVKILLNRWEKKLSKLFPEDADEFERYQVSEATIRRIVEPFKKK